jgi:undecaprenyl diphosphate synthase
LSKKSLQKKLEEIKQNDRLPNHIAIIMDGNGRWAKMRGLPRVAGHRQGIETVRKIVKACAELDIKYLTLYTFSTENWRRPKEEVSTLMRLIVNSLRKETDDLHKNNVKLNVIGDISSLPEKVVEELKESIEKTRFNSKLILTLALSYSGRWEILNAIKNICGYVSEKNINAQDYIASLDEKEFSKFLSTNHMPDPDLLIRSGGEFRISNFLLWQIAYSEIYIDDTLWPDYNENNLYDAILDYQKRERRFGMVSEQIKKKYKK